MIRIFFSIILIFSILQTSAVSFADKFPKVLSCVKGESDDFTLHLVTLIEQTKDGTGEAFVDDRSFKLVLDDGIWLGTSKKGTEFLILEDDKIKIISGKSNWDGVCFRSDDALAPLVKTVSQPLSIKIDSLTKELHKLKSELALIEIENSKLIEKIEDNISEEGNIQEKVEIFLESGMTANSIVNKINSTENLKGFIDYVPEEGSLATGKLFFKFGESREKVLSKIMLLQRANLGRAWLMRSRNTILKSPRELLI